MSWEASFLLWIQENVRSDAWTPIVTFITHLGDHGCILDYTYHCVPVMEKDADTGNLDGNFTGMQLPGEQYFVKKSGGADQTLRGGCGAEPDY